MEISSKKYSVSPIIKNEVNKKFKPVLSNFFQNSASLDFYKKNSEGVNDRLDKVRFFNNHVRRSYGILEKGITESELDKSSAICERNFFLANFYLLSVELAGNAIVDMTILLLISTGCDFHLEPDDRHRYTRHASSLEDLESPLLSLSVKLDYLALNGLDFFTKMIDRRLRNKIAHFDFEFSEDGEFRVENKKIDLIQKMGQFTNYYVALAEILNEVAESVRAEKATKILGKIDIGAPTSAKPL